MKDTDMIEKDKQKNIPQNVVMPAFCEKKADRILTYVQPDEGQLTDRGTV